MKIKTLWKLAKQYKGPIAGGILSGVLSIWSEIDNAKLRNTVAELGKRVTELEKK